MVAQNMSRIEVNINEKFVRQFGLLTKTKSTLPESVRCSASNL